MMGFKTIPSVDKPIDAGLYTAVITRKSDEGIQEVEFTFKNRLDSPEYHFLFGSPHFLAYPLDMSALVPDKAETSPGT